MTFHFLSYRMQNGVLEVIHYSTQKQLANVLSKAVKTKHFIHMRDGICVVEFS